MIFFRDYMEFLVEWRFIEANNNASTCDNCDITRILIGIVVQRITIDGQVTKDTNSIVSLFQIEA